MVNILSIARDKVTGKVLSEGEYCYNKETKQVTIVSSTHDKTVGLFLQDQFKSGYINTVYVLPKLIIQLLF